MSKSILGKWCKELGFCYSGVKYKCISNAILILCNQPVTFLKASFQHSCFSVNFCKILKNTCFAEHLQKFASNDIIIVTTSRKIYWNNHFLQVFPSPLRSMLLDLPIAPRSCYEQINDPQQYRLNRTWKYIKITLYIKKFCTYIHTHYKNYKLTAKKLHLIHVCFV